MENSLKNLSSRLEHLGSLDEAKCVNKMIELIAGLDNASIIKSSAATQTASGLNAFLGAVDIAPHTGGVSEVVSEEYEAWSKIINDFDKVPNQVEKFHEIANNVATTVIRPLKAGYDKIRGSGAPEPTDAGRSSTKFKINQMSVEPHNPSSDEQLAASILRTSALIPSGSKKIASSNKYLLLSTARSDEEIGMSLLDSLDSNREVSNYTSGAHGTAVESSKWSRSHGSGIKPVRAKPGWFGRAFSIIGILFSGPLLVKNTYEAWQNGSAILNELPLAKYGIPTGAALTGLGAGKLLRKIKQARDENIDDPEALYEILEISKTISAFWLDIVFAVTNALMFIIDILTLIVAFVDGPLPIADVAAGFIGMLLSFGLMGVELYTESVVHKFWDKENLKIKEIAEKNLERLANSESQEQPAVQTADETSQSAQPGLMAFLGPVRSEPMTANS